MTSGTELVTILTTWVSILILIVVLRLWASVRLDSFRQSMFTLRDEMFDYACAGNISFDNPAYLLLRKSMNGFIRYAHNITFFRLTLTMFYWHVFTKPPDPKWSESWNRAVSAIPDEEVRGKMQAFHQKSLYLVANRLVLGSPFLWALFLMFLVDYGLNNLREALKRSFSQFIDPKVLEEEAARVAA